MVFRPLPNVIWNLFLAIIPVVLSLIIFAGVRLQRRAPGGRVSWALWMPILVIWFLFLPNTCYLFTEWRHYLNDLTRTPNVVQDAEHNELLLFEFLAMTGFYVFYTGSGLLTFYLAIYPLDVLFAPHWSVRPLFFFLCALGVYLGLVDRFNSWQVARHPHEILHAAHVAVKNPVILFLMALFSLFLWLLYTVFGLTMDGVRMRYRKYRPA